MEWYKRFYLGTWQLSGQFKKLTMSQIESLLLFAVNSGICRFDTAPVYGKGRVEDVLGSCLPQDAVIVTKIPATEKPSMKSTTPIGTLYSLESMERSLEGSLARLRRNHVDTVLLHNWLPCWSSEAEPVLGFLNKLKSSGRTQRIGISLPDNFSFHIAESVLPFIDVIEAPFNPQQQWIFSQLPELLRLKKEVILRSLFCQGKLISPDRPAESFVNETFALGTSVVIGMTTEEQIVANIRTLKGVYHGTQ